MSLALAGVVDDIAGETARAEEAEEVRCLGAGQGRRRSAPFGCFGLTTFLFRPPPRRTQDISGAASQALSVAADARGDAATNAGELNSLKMELSGVVDELSSAKAVGAPPPLPSWHGTLTPSRPPPTLATRALPLLSSPSCHHQALSAEIDTVEGSAADNAELLRTLSGQIVAHGTRISLSERSIEAALARIDTLESVRALVRAGVWGPACLQPVASTATRCLLLYACQHAAHSRLFCRM